MIDEYSPHVPCWLVWSTSVSGLVTLEAICLNEGYAKTTRSTLLRERSEKLVLVTIEKSEANHMFAGDLDEKWWELYGSEAFKRSENLKIELAQKERNVYKEAGNNLLNALRNKNEKEINKAISNWIIISEGR